MWSSVKRFFGVASDTPATDAAGSDDEDHAPLNPLQSMYRELTAVRADVAAVSSQLDKTATALEGTWRKEMSLREQREALVLECHDATLYPQLGGALPDDEETALCAEVAAIPANELDAALRDANVTTADELLSKRRKEQCRVVSYGLASQVAVLTKDFEGILSTLVERREKLDEAAFRLQMRLTALEAQEDRTEQQMREAAGERHVPLDLELQAVVVGGEGRTSLAACPAPPPKTAADTAEGGPDGRGDGEGSPPNASHTTGPGSPCVMGPDDDDDDDDDGEAPGAPGAASHEPFGMSAAVKEPVD